MTVTLRSTAVTAAFCVAFCAMLRGSMRLLTNCDTVNGPYGSGPKSLA